LSEPLSNAATFVRAVETSEVLPDRPAIVRVGDYEVAIFLVDGRVEVYENACPHQGGPIGEGLIEGDTVTCPWHAWTFDLHSGEMAIGPGFARLRSFESRVRDGWVEVAAEPEPV
jgi:nitrite reductase/ring-hydroxylating ferredoxin subunit